MDDMSRRCVVTGAGPLTGNHVSHSNVKTKRRQLPNLQNRRLWSEAEQRFVNLRLSVRALRTIAKKGVDAVLRELREAGQKV